MTGEPLLTEDDIAQLLKLPNREAVRYLRRTAGLPYLKIGKRIRFRPSQIELWLKQKEM